jgi:GDP-L-fucose synthase
MKTVLITGGEGLVGSAFPKENDKYKFIHLTRKDGDLRNELAVKAIFEKYKPNFVIHAAAKVGGIGANLEFPAEQYFDNIMMNTLVIEYAKRNRIEKLITFGSSCSIDSDLKNYTEADLQTGCPHEFHKYYAYAKRMADVQIEAYNKEFGTNYCSLILGNIFGEHDNFNLKYGHVIPSLVHKCFLAKKSNTPFKVWGSGNARREFIYSKDIVRVCLSLLSRDKLPQRLIVSNKNMAIKDIVLLISEIYEYYNIEWETDKPEGQLNRTSNHALFNKEFPNFNYTDIKTALTNTCNWFSTNYELARE